MHMKKSRYRHLAYNRFVTEIVRYCITRFLRRFFRVSVQGLPALRLKPPYIVLAQHSSVWDPIVYNLHIKIPLHFIVSDAQFRSPFMRCILAFVGSITKKKSAVDMRAALEIAHILKTRKESICIFPEGVNTWDGCSSQIITSTAKLIKRAQVPVVCARSHGAYLSRPRWGRGARRGAWRVQYTLCLTPDTIEKLDDSAILTCIKKALYNDEYENQRKNTEHFISSKAAEYIERVLFACPYCETVQSLISKKTFFYCRVCCNMWRFCSDGSIQRRRHGPLLTQHVCNVAECLSTVAKWNAWQQKFLQHLVAETQKRTSQPSTLFYDEDMQLFWGKRRMVDGGNCGSCELTCSALIFVSHDRLYSHKNSFRTAITDMKSVNVQNNEKLEWTSPQGMTYQLRSRNPRVNTYKYLCAVRLLQT